MGDPRHDRRKPKPHADGITVDIGAGVATCDRCGETLRTRDLAALLAFGRNHRLAGCRIEPKQLQLAVRR